VILDETLLHHRHRLRGDGEVAAVAEGVAGAEGHRESEAERVVRERAGHGVGARAECGATTAAEGEAELAVPSRTRLLAAGRPRRPDRIRRVVDDRDPVDRLVERAGLYPDDVIDHASIDGG